MKEVSTKKVALHIFNVRRCWRCGLDYNYLLELFEACLEIEYQHVEEGGSFATLRDGDKLWIFFEKSNGREDWFNNLSYRAVKVEREGEVWFCHEGFLKVWQAVLPYLHQLLSSPSVKQVSIVGYSHGAALALLCHEYVGYLRPDLEDALEGYGFGCPRVILGVVPDEGRRWRSFYVVRNVDDAVTHLPPRFIGYRHVGKLIMIGKRGRYSAIDAHKPENYIRELNAAHKQLDKP